MTSKSNIAVRYSETDQMGIVHHSVYPVWYEVARTDYIKLVNMTYSDMENAGVMMPVIELKCKYSGAARYEDVLTVEVKMSMLTPVRVEFEYTIYKNGEPKPIHTGSTMHAWVNKDMRPVNLKKYNSEIYSAIEKALD
jgi:acyl-CoA thioester hydrolase